MMDATTIPQKSKNHMESHGDYSCVVISSARFRIIICKDNWQWIIQSRSGTRRGGAYYKSVSHHRDRASLKRHWRDFVGAEEGTKELDRLPKSFGRDI